MTIGPTRADLVVATERPECDHDGCNETWESWVRPLTNAEFDHIAKAWAKENRYFKIGPPNSTFDEMARKRGYVKPSGDADIHRV
jgi:hypothetical protein